MRIVDTLRTSSRASLLQVGKTSIAAIASWFLCELIFSSNPPIFAAIAALLVVQPSVNQSLSKGIERSIGVIAGVVLAFAIGAIFGTASWVVLASIVVSLLVAWVLRLGPGSSAQIPISAMLVLSIGGLTPTYAVERIIETIIGAAVGLIVNLAIVPPVQLRPAHLAVGRLVRELAVTLDAIAASLTSDQSRDDLEALLSRGRALLPLRDGAEAAIARGRESLMLNPRGGRLERVLDDDEALFRRLSALRVRVTGMTRTVHDNWDESLVAEPTVGAIAAELKRAAHDLRLLGRGSESGSGHPGNTPFGNAPFGTAPFDGDEPLPITSELPALTAPLSIMRPHPDHWILIGSLLEDLRRVREEIIGDER